MRKIPELDYRKDVHFALLPETQYALRLMCFKHGLSMQEVFEEFANRLVMEEPRMLRMLDDLAENKKHHRLRELSRTDAESIFDMIEHEAPFK